MLTEMIDNDEFTIVSPFKNKNKKSTSIPKTLINRILSFDNRMSLLLLALGLDAHLSHKHNDGVFKDSICMGTPQYKLMIKHFPFHLSG